MKYQFYDSFILDGTVDLKRRDCLAAANLIMWGFKSREFSLTGDRKQKSCHKGKSEI